MPRDVLRGDVPLLVLAALNEAAGHGYAIARRVEAHSEKALQMKEGTLYPALRVLEQEGLIEGEWQLQPSGPARKVYKITSSGLLELNKRREAWQGYVRTMQQLIGGISDAQTA